LTVAEYSERKARRSEATRITYSEAEAAFARCFKVRSADALVHRIKAHRLDAYKALDKFVSYLLANGSAPKTVLTYVTAIKGLMRYEGISLDNYQLRARVELPPKVEVSTDRIPTREQIRTILLNSNRRTRALISLLATSGLRVGEAAGLRAANLELLSNKVMLMSTRTKSRKTRVTFFTDETAGFIREYLRQRINRKDEWLFPGDHDESKHDSADALYMGVYRVLKLLFTLPHVTASSNATIQDTTSSFIDDLGYFHVVGEVKNTGDVWIGYASAVIFARNIQERATQLCRLAKPSATIRLMALNMNHPPSGYHCSLILGEENT
jgi:integrase